MPIFPVMSLLSFFVVHDYTTMIIMTLVGFPIGMFYACAAFPMQLHIFPKETFGQFGSADAVVRSILSIALTAVAGFFLDMMSHFYGGNEEYYRWMYIWCAFFQFCSLLFVANIYRLWKKHGGLHGYKPPDVGTRSTELPDGWFDGKHGKT